MPRERNPIQNHEVFNREPFNLEFLADDQVEPGFLYLGEGGNLRSLAVSRLADEDQISFVGIKPWAGDFRLDIEPFDPSRYHGRYFRPLKQMMPAPDLEGDYLLGWIHRINQSHTRRMIAEISRLEESLAQDPIYWEYLDFLRDSLKSLDRPLG